MQSILLVEDHVLFAKAVSRLLARTEDLKVAMVALSGEEALRCLSRQDFDLAVVDVSLPRMSGIKLVSLIRYRYPALPCLMLSGHLLATYAQSALQAGARGYVLKDKSPDILEGIRHVLRGETYVSEELRCA